MTKLQRLHVELKELLEEQIQFLQSSADAFDRGFESEAKRLAVTARVLLHDTRKSDSLLSQLGCKSIEFWDTALPNEPGNESSHGGLVFVAYADRATKWVSMLDDVPYIRKLSFDEWWNAPVFIDDNRKVLSRRDLILIAANQDGGAHVDPALNETYARLQKENTMGAVITDSAGTRPMGGPVLAAIRQIAHELLKSIKSDYSAQPKHQTDIIFGGVTLISEPTEKSVVNKTKDEFHFTSKRPTRNSANKIGRNEKCYCGSGLKFKKCHGFIN